ncbi:MAG: hypothetical protein NTW93_03255 [Phycisphaerae bacterium]|nr:hypothetical protein [Phycisphaerae bacterium]
MRAVIKRYVILAVFALAAAQLQAVTYYVDSVDGNDTYNGTSEGTAWKTLAKVNAKTFAAGDYLLFKAGGIWIGQLHPLGSGAAGPPINPIVIDMYGDPNAGKPIIDGNGVIGNGAVYLYNQKYWEINNLEVINDANSGGDRRGIYLAASNFGTVQHLYVRNCYIHNIKGKIGTDGDLEAKRTGGIVVETVADNTTPTRFNDILIENCVISTVDQQGIALNNKVASTDYPGTTYWDRRKFTNVIIRNNSINDVAKNAMIIRLTDETGLIEYNVCWDTAERALTGNTIFSRSCRGTVFQYNEGYLNKADGSKDGSLYDADMQSPKCIFQYSYSHNNNDGLFTQCTDPADDNVIVRYNISRNDKGRIFCMSYANTSTYVYNNTVYIPSDLSPTIIDDKQATTKAYYFYNNIFYNMSTTATYNFLSGATRIFSHNVFYNDSHCPSGEPNDNDDPNRLTSDPMLVNPGTGDIPGDVINDVIVDWSDMQELAGQWLNSCIEPDWCGGCDIDKSGQVDFVDFSKLAKNWLYVVTGLGLDTVDGYKLQPDSPCIDSGMNIANNGGFDYWGNEMPYNGITDRGFYEWPGTDPSDTTAPRPNPMTWATPPHSTSPTSIAMTATTAVDACGVEYYFTCTAGGGHNNGWQASPTYTDTGLVPSTSYTYTVKARDLSENLNVTADSPPASATTAADTSPPLPNPITWAITPHQVSSNAISMTATTATDDSGVEYYFTNIADSEHDSGWQASSTYIDTGLSLGTYSYQVRARDTSLAHNTGGWSDEQFATIEVFDDIPGDVTKDGIVNWNDMQIFAGQWLNTCSSPDWCNGCDIDKSGTVDFVDFSKLAENWL